MKIVALLGEPASGKTHIARMVFKSLGPGLIFKHLKLTGTYHPQFKVYVFGSYTGHKFDGTDRLSMGVQPDAKWFLSLKKVSSPEASVFFEGDRLGNLSFLNECLTIGALYPFFVKVSEATLKKRHAQRSDSQTDTFLKGRRTKIANLLTEFGGHKGNIFNNDKPETAVEIAKTILKTLTSNP